MWRQFEVGQHYDDHITLYGNSLEWANTIVNMLHYVETA